MWIKFAKCNLIVEFNCSSRLMKVRKFDFIVLFFEKLTFQDVYFVNYEIVKEESNLWVGVS